MRSPFIYSFMYNSVDVPHLC